ARISSSGWRQGTPSCETKGMDTEQDQTKRRFLDEWVKAVNAHGGVGSWRYGVVLYPKEVLGDSAQIHCKGADMNWPKGSKWRKWDLHVHSPASHGFAGDWNQFIIQLGNADTLFKEGLVYEADRHPRFFQQGAGGFLPLEGRQVYGGAIPEVVWPAEALHQGQRLAQRQ
ncbi:MAG: hypothetical protein M3461_07265, partial [Pseudomonadota bacterium]|nr:hypothetical protein [Pseudomonadota bacterium]